MSLRALVLGVVGVAAIAALGCVNTSGGRGGGDDGDGGGDGDESASASVVACATKSRACTPDDGVYEQGVEYCSLDDSGEEQWTACCGYEQLECECEPPWGQTAQEVEACWTPLVLAFESQPVVYTTEMTGSFDLTGAGMSVATDWPTAATPWLALDRDGNGRIDDGGELFGSATVLPSGLRAPNGFAALAALDDSGDGVLDAGDAAFARLLVWRDVNGNRSSEASELSPASAELLSITLGYTVEPRCDARGNCEMERAALRYLDASGRERVGSVVDVHLRRQ